MVPDKPAEAMGTAEQVSGLGSEMQRDSGRRADRSSIAVPRVALTIARASSNRAASYGSPVSGKLTRGPASENTRGTMACSALSIDRIEAQLPRERQILVVLKPTPEVGELNRRHRSGHTAILFGCSRSSPGIHEHAVAMDESLVVWRSVRLATIVERDAVRPDILVALSLFLRVVTPVHGVPVEIHGHIVLERGPDRRARIGGGSVDGDGGPTLRPSAVVEPELPAARSFARDAIELKTLWALNTRCRSPDRAPRRRLVTKVGSARPGPGFEWMFSASARMCGYSGGRGSSGM